MRCTVTLFGMEACLTQVFAKKLGQKVVARLCHCRLASRVCEFAPLLLEFDVRSVACYLISNLIFNTFLFYSGVVSR